MTQRCECGQEQWVIGTTPGPDGEWTVWCDTCGTEYGIGTLIDLWLCESAIKRAFEDGYAKRSGITTEQLYAMGCHAIPCDCGEEGCCGWQMIHGESETAFDVLEQECSRAIEWPKSTYFAHITNGAMASVIHQEGE